MQQAAADCEADFSLIGFDECIIELQRYDVKKYLEALGMVFESDLARLLGDDAGDDASRPGGSDAGVAGTDATDTAANTGAGQIDEELPLF